MRLLSDDLRAELPGEQLGVGLLEILDVGVIDRHRLIAQVLDLAGSSYPTLSGRSDALPGLFPPSWVNPARRSTALAVVIAPAVSSSSLRMTEGTRLCSARRRGIPSRGKRS